MSSSISNRNSPKNNKSPIDPNNTHLKTDLKENFPIMYTHHNKEKSPHFQKKKSTEPIPMPSKNLQCTQPTNSSSLEYQKMKT